MNGLASGLDYVFLAICCFTASIVLSQRAPRRDHAMAVSAFLLLAGLDKLDDIAAQGGLYQNVSWLTHWGMVTVLALPFFIYLYTLAVTRRTALSITKLSPQHGLAFLVGLALLLPYLTLDGDIKLAIELELDHPEIESFRVMSAVAIGAWIFVPYFQGLFLVYLLLSLKAVACHHRRIYDVFSDVENKTLRWLQIMLLILAMIWVYSMGDFILTMIFDLPDLPDAIDNLVMTMLLGAFCYFGLRQGAIFELMQSNGDNEIVLDGAVVQRFSLESDHAQRIAGKLKTAMARDHLYRDSMLTLRQLSDKTSISEHHISEVLNRHLNSSFYDFVNGWRLDEAKHLLTTDPERTALTIAMDVGFNSKSTFYTAFKKQNGQSPIAFRNAAMQAA